MDYSEHEGRGGISGEWRGVRGEWQEARGEDKAVTLSTREQCIRISQQRAHISKDGV